MQVLSDNTEILLDSWDDPGDYPSNAGSGPLPSYDYVAGIEGEIEVQLTWKEYLEFCSCINCESVNFWLDEVYEYEYPSGILSAKWQHEISGGERYWFLWHKPVTIKFWTEDVEEDPDYQGPEPPDHDDYYLNGHQP